MAGLELEAVMADWANTEGSCACALVAIFGDFPGPTLHPQWAEQTVVGGHRAENTSVQKDQKPQGCSSRVAAYLEDMNDDRPSGNDRHREMQTLPR